MRRFLKFGVVGCALGIGGCPDDLDVSGARGAPIYQTFEFSTMRQWSFITDDPGEGRVDYRLAARQLSCFASDDCVCTEEGEVKADLKADQKEACRQKPWVESIGGEDVHTLQFQYDCLRSTCVESEGPTDSGLDTDISDSDESPPAGAAQSCACKGLNATEAFRWRVSSSLTNGVLFHAFGDTTFDPPVTLSAPRMLRGSTVESSSGGVNYTATFAEQEMCPAEDYWPVPDQRAECYKVTLEADAPSPLAGTYWLAPRFIVPVFDNEGGGGVPWRIKSFEEQEFDRQ